jgi:phosphatidylinositol-3-phosphatase
MKKLACVLVLAATACTAATANPHHAPTTSSPGPLTSTAGAPLVVVVMENHRASDIIGNPSAPWMNAFAQTGRLFTNYREGEAGSSSLPDYLQMAAGSSCGKTTDKIVAGDRSIVTAGCGTTVWNQLESAGRTWAVYEEGMPTPCYGRVTYTDLSTNGQYALKHNPATPFPAVWDDQALCKAHVLPLSSMSPTALPDVSFITPNICNDMHGSASTAFTNCDKGTQAIIARGDAWLRDNVQPLLDAGARLFVTFDESGRLYAALGGGGISPSVDATVYTHYSLLAGIEDSYGLARLNGAANASPLPLT